LKETVSFPFGWIRGLEKENWQLLWNPETGIFFAKGATSKRIVKIGETSNWIEAKALADKVNSEPGLYREIIITRKLS